MAIDEQTARLLVLAGVVAILAFSIAAVVKSYRERTRPEAEEFPAYEW